MTLANTEARMPIYVRERDYDQVVLLLADLLLDEVEDEAEEDDGLVEDWQEWTEDEIAALKLTINPMGKAVMDVGSDDQDMWFTFQKVCEESGLSTGSARAGLSGLTRHVKSRYGHGSWPFRAAWGSDLGFSAEMYYMVPAEVGEWWKNA